MPAFGIPSRLEITLLFLGYVVVAQSRHLPDGVSLVGYVVGYLCLLLIPLSALEPSNGDDESV